MQKILSLSMLVFGMLLPFSCSGANSSSGNDAKSQGSAKIVPRSDVDILKDYNWTDGSVIYRFKTSETPHVATHPLKIKRSSTAIFSQEELSMKVDMIYVLIIIKGVCGYLRIPVMEIIIRCEDAM